MTSSIGRYDDVRRFAQPATEYDKLMVSRARMLHDGDELKALYNRAEKCEPESRVRLATHGIEFRSNSLFYKVKRLWNRSIFGRMHQFKEITLAKKRNKDAFHYSKNLLKNQFSDFYLQKALQTLRTTRDARLYIDDGRNFNARAFVKLYQQTRISILKDLEQAGFNALALGTPPLSKADMESTRAPYINLITSSKV